MIEIRITDRVRDEVNGHWIYPPPFVQAPHTCLAYGVTYCLEMHRRLHNAMTGGTDDLEPISIDFLLNHFYIVIDGNMSLRDSVHTDTVLNHFTDFGVDYVNANGRQPFQTPIWDHIAGEANDALERVREYLQQRGPFLAVFRIDESFNMFNGRGVYGVTRGPQPLSTHLVTVIGIGYDEITGQPLLEYVNTYGREWGFDGVSYIWAYGVVEYWLMRSF